MTTVPFDAFIRLIEFDRAMKHLSSEIAAEEKKVALLHTQKALLLQDIEQCKHAVHDTQKAVDAQELDMKVLDERAAVLKHKLENIQNTKEYNSLKKELDAIHAQQHGLEDALVGAWHQLEVSQRVLQQKNATIAQTLASADKEIAEKEAQVKVLHEQLAAQRLERVERMHTIPAEWLEKYEGMYMRVDDPAVPVSEGACSGCFYPVASQDLARLKRRALLQCNSCYRFLYDPSMLQPEQQA